jgi:hypothetical protein
MIRCHSEGPHKAQVLTSPPVVQVFLKTLLIC